MPNSVGSNRREFLREAALTLVVLSGCSDSTGPSSIDGVTISVSTVTIDLTVVTALGPTGSALFIPGAKVGVLHTAQSTFKAFNDDVHACGLLRRCLREWADPLPVPWLAVRHQRAGRGGSCPTGAHAVHDVI
ncbi:MAG: hypothetical protein U0163_06870 [Gemmatimonadaceae bacterium]